jgi:hypothetical protein
MSGFVPAGSLTHKMLTFQGQVWWYTAVIPAPWEVEVGGSQFKASPGKQFARFPRPRIFKTTIKQNGLEVWLKQ